MKARVKATGEIVEVICILDSGKSYYERLDVLDTKPIKYSVDELDFSDILGEAYETTYTTDYWTRLKHQYAGMAMQSLIMKDCSIDEIVSISDEIAHALVEKMKQNNNNQ